jgi:hypothetical protein
MRFIKLKEFLNTFFSKKQKNLNKQVNVNSVKNLFKKSYPNLISKHIYQKPQYRPTKWAVLHGPCYGEKKFKGTLLIDLSQMMDWSINHAAHTWTNQSLEQGAKEYFPEWLKRIDLQTEAITFLDKGQYGFLKDYYSEFVNRGWHQIYCPQCRITYKELNRQTLNEKHSGLIISWTVDWRCVAGHILYRHDDSIRMIQ